MKAAVLYSTVSSGTSYAEAHPLQVEELDRPEPRAGELGIAITYSSLCHSDLSVVDGSRVRPLPMALGHEAVGRVEAVG
jgi:alcohol dehydrogenase